MDGRQFHVRSWALSGLLVLLLLALGVGLYRTQIIDGAYYAELSRHKIANMETIEAGRGMITDANGQPLVTNRVSYQVTLDTGRMGDEGQRAHILIQLLDICAACGVEWTDTLPITAQPPFEFTEREPFHYRTEDESGRAKWNETRLYRLATAMKWIRTGDGPVDLPAADELVNIMCRDLGIPVGDMVRARQAVGVLYELYLRSKDVYRTPYIFARDVDIDFITRVKERGLAGVKIQPTSVRQYDTPYAAHLLGRVGLMDAEEWAVYKEKDIDGDGKADYEMDDSVGKEGVEKVFEDWLRGRTGLRSVELNTNGKVVTQEWIKEPVAGGTVELTLDIGLQQAVEDSLARRIPNLSGNAQGAAAVIIDVKNAGVLASASYPTFDLSRYSADYNDNAADPLKPLYNRALLGTYAPGSTFKMVTGIAGLEEGIITPRTQILDTGVYRYYTNDGPRCWIYNQSGGTHGQQTVADAIKNSCNVFFYDVGRRLGIERLQEYAAMFGLGQKTGLELGERAGVMAGPEYTESMGGTWYPGNTLSVSIGQESSQFTPIQLANYVATLVNGGTRYKTHLMSRVLGADGTVLYEYEPEVLDTLKLKKENLDAVKAGMLALTQEGSLARYFTDIPIKVGAKTGSAQVSASSKESNAVLVCFAPFDDPEIALAIVAERGGGGSELGAVAADIFRWYFREEIAAQNPAPEPELPETGLEE
ncbi:MAG: penicillin-binding protein [Oscillospiraceae bacterium]|nr:penicillin-binding protein [Oscillospiraceae bacterium]